MDRLQIRLPKAWYMQHTQYCRLRSRQHDLFVVMSTAPIKDIICRKARKHCEAELQVPSGQGLGVVDL